MKTVIRLIFTLFVFSPFYNAMASKVNYCTEYIRIWGLIKYYSTYQTNFIPNLDSAFQHDIKNIINRNSEKVFNNAINNLIEYTSQRKNSVKPRVNPISKTVQTDSVNSWIFNNTNISRKNRSYLIYLTQNRGRSSNPFVKNDPDSFNAIFTNEKRFISPFPSTEIRLLALARYWNAVYYFYPHKNLINVNWNTVLEVFLNELTACKNEFDFHLTILRFASLIVDGHGSVNSYSIDKHYGLYQLPFEVSYINNQIFITKILKTVINNPFKHGDKIIEINNQSFDEYYELDSCYIWGSNTNRKKNISAAHFIRSQNEKENIVKLSRYDSIIEVASPYIGIYSFKDSELVNYKPKQTFLVGDNFVYLDLSLIDSVDFEKIVLQSKKQNIIVDMRYYPNWVLNQIADLFAINDVPFAAYIYPEISSPGRFSPPQLLFLEPKLNSVKSNYEHIILIVDYTTISRGEFLCMAFQSLPNVITFGDKTAGADGNISKILLPGNISTQFTGLGILYPDGQPTQHAGIKIDIRFHKNGTGISSGQDEELNYILDSIVKEGKR